MRLDNKTELLPKPTDRPAATVAALVPAAGCALAVAGCAVVLIGPPALAVGSAAASAIADSADLIGVLVQAGLVLGFAFTVAALGGLARWAWRLADRAGLVTLPTGYAVPLAVLQAHGSRFAAEALTRHYDVAALEAAHGPVPHVYSPNVTYRAEPQALEAKADPTEVPALAPPINGPVLQALAARGWLQPDRLWVGTDSQAEPAYIDLALCGAVAVAGLPRSGKTSTATLLIAQAAYHGHDLMVCDPHAAVAGHGLLSKIAPLTGCLAKQAVTDDEIAHAIGLVAKIARRRLTGQDSADRPVILVVDEFTALIARRVLPDEVIADLLAVAVEAPKVKVHLLLLAQDWTASLLGTQHGASLRRVITHRIVHRADPGTAAFLLPTPNARDAGTLIKGRALFWPADGMPVQLAVPEVQPADLAQAARGVPPKPYVSRPALQAPPVVPVVPSVAPSQALTVAGKIKALLRDGTPRNSEQIADDIAEDRATVQTALTRLAQASEITREGSPRRYTYRA